MASFGKIEPFSGRSEDFECYWERVQQYFMANDLEQIKLKDDNSNTDEVQQCNKHMAIFRSVIGQST